MMKNLLTWVLLFVAVTAATAQTTQPQVINGKSTNWCISQEITQRFIDQQDAAAPSQNPKGHNVQKQTFNSRQRQFIQNQGGQTRPDGGAKAVRTIPVVVHVVWNTAAHNVPDADIYEMMDVLNEDFRALNADISSVRAAFTSVIGDSEIEFCLASKAPDGSSTSGIERFNTAEAHFDSDTETNKMKYTATGGLDAWDPTKYLNVWVCNISNGAGFGTAGYAYLPTPGMHGSSIDGLVLDYDIGIGNRSRTCTHEIGHYMGLNHTWGPAESCSNDDGFADTPDCGGPNYFCNYSAASCSSTDQIENFMDYADCSAMYSIEQCAYMNSILSGTRSSLLSSNGCEPTTAPTADFTVNSQTVAAGGFVNYSDLSTGNPDTWNWSLTGGTPATATTSNHAVQYNTVGVYPSAMTVTNSLGTDNITKTAYITVTAPTGCDTLNQIPIADLAAYITTDGAVAGHNEYGDQAKAQFFPLADYSPNTHVTGVQSAFFFAYEDATASTVQFTVYADDGAANVPGTVLGGGVMDLADIVTDVTNGTYTTILFNSPVDITSVTTGFYVAVEMIGFTATGNTPSDTLGLFSNSAGQGSMNSWEFSDLGAGFAWNDMNTAWGGSHNTDLAISPFMTNVPPTGAFTQDVTEVCEGGDVTFDAGASINGEEYYWDYDGDGLLDWYSPNTTITINYATAGTYDVTLLTVGKCSGLDYLDKMALITVNPLPALAMASNDATCGACNGDATVTPSGASAPYTIDWITNGNDPNANITGLCTGAYQVVVTDNKGCSSGMGVNISDGSTLLTTASATDENCGFGNGTATASPSGGSGGYSYLWSNGGTDQTITGLNAGSYNVTVTDGGGCIASTNFTSQAVVNNIVTVLTVSGSANNADCTGSNGDATATGSGGQAPYTYLWDAAAGSQATATAANLAAGSYVVTATDAYGCTGATTVTVGANASAVTIATSDNPEICGNAGGDATATPSNGTAPYTYGWDVATGSQTGATATALAAATYGVTVTDVNGCSATTTATVSSSAGTLAVTTSKTDETCTAADGTATANATGGQTAYSYVWSNGAGNLMTVSSLAATTYGVTVTDGNGCTAVSSAIVGTNNGSVAVTFSTTNEVCTNASGTATATATGGLAAYSYQWAANAASQATQTASNLTAGNYSVTATDGNGCTATGIATVNGTASGVVASVTCTPTTSVGGSDGSAALSVTGENGALTYAWSDLTNGASASGLSQGTISVTVTDTDGCTATDNCFVNDPGCGATTASVSVVDANCNGVASGTASATMTGGGTAFTYQWDDGGAQVAQTAITLLAGTYNVTVTDNNGCVATASGTVNEPTALTASATGTNETCLGNDGSVATTVGGGTTNYSYAWNGAAAGSGATAAGLPAGTYTATVTDANGCTIMAGATITQDVFTASATTDNDVSCNGLSDGGATAAGSGGTPTYTYVWDGGETTASVTNLTAGSHNATVTDQAGCSQIVSAVIAEPTALTAAVTCVSITAAGANDGSASVTVAGGTTAYTYDWSNGGNTANVSGLSVGNITVSVTDANGCMAIDVCSITQPTALCALAGTVAKTNSTCNADDDATATMTVSAGQTPFSYAWSNGSTTASISNLSPNTYTVLVMDGMGCTITESVTTTEPDALLASIATTNASCSAADGSATANVVGGTMNYNYTWSTAEATASIANLAAGTYDVTVVDANGCMVTATSNVIADGGNMTPVIDQGIVACEGDMITITAAGALGYNWGGGQTDSAIVVTVSTDAVFTVTVDDGAGCSQVLNSSVTVNATPVTAVTASADTICDGASVTLNATGGTSYNWVGNAATTSSITVFPPQNTTYSVMAMANGCMGNSASVTVVTEASPIANINVNEFAGVGTLVNFDAYSSTGDSFSWDFDNDGNEDATGVEAEHTFNTVGQHVVTLIASSSNTNCTGTTTVTINIVPTSVQENMLANSLKFYPNPTTGLLTVDFNLVNNDDVTVSIHNAVGQVVASISKNDINKGHFNFDISDNATGIYFVRVTTVGNAITKKLTLIK